MFFIAADEQHGFALWRTDGSEQETFVVQDTFHDDSDAPPVALAAIGNTLYFTAYNDVLFIVPPSIWKSDGTVEGTNFVSRPGSGELVEAGGRIFFRLCLPGRGCSLWREDGSSAFTTEVAPIGSPGVPSHLSVVGQTLFFFGDGFTGPEPWTSDGSATGTRLLRDINPGPAGSFVGDINEAESGSHRPLNLDNVLYFAADDGTYGAELWRSDATPDGTVLVKDLTPGPEGSNPTWLTNVAGTMFFSTFNQESGGGLWKSDGTEAGTQFLASIAADSLTDVDGVLFFRGYDDVHGTELWKSDGTPEGTVLVKDIRPGDASSSPKSLISANGHLLFGACGFAPSIDPHLPAADCELWVSNGTTNGTHELADIADDRSSDPGPFVIVEDLILFPASDGIYGRELWGLPLNSVVSDPLNNGEAGAQSSGGGCVVRQERHSSTWALLLLGAAIPLMLRRRVT